MLRTTAVDYLQILPVIPAGSKVAFAYIKQPLNRHNQCDSCWLAAFA